MARKPKNKTRGTRRKTLKTNAEKTEFVDRKDKGTANVPGAEKTPAAKKPTYQPVPRPKRGILILALGHPNYGQFAANLAMSIRFTDKQIPIHLVWHGQALDHLSAEKKALFSSFEPIPEEFITKNGKVAYFKAKTYLYELSPFEETLYLDADMLWNGGSKPIAGVFELLKDVGFTVQNRDFVDLSREQIGKSEWLWGDPNEVKKAYGLTAGKLFGLHAELIYFKRSGQNEQYFRKVQEVFQNPLAKPKDVAGDIADEYAFAIASLLCNHYPHRTPFMMVYWHLIDGKVTQQLQRITNEWWAYSAGGINPPQKMKEQYDLMVRAYAAGVGIQNPWKLQPKKNFITERRLM